MIINAVVYKERKKEYTAVGLEIGQIATGKTSDDAMNDYLTAVKNQKLLKKHNSSTALFQSPIPPRAFVGLEKIAMSKKNISPIVKKVDNMEVHFYKI